MKPDIHPQYKEVQVTCSCGSVFTTRSTMAKDTILLEVCSKCHPFYTGNQKIMDTAGRVDRFRQKYGMKGKKEAVKEAAPAKAEVEAKETVIESAKVEEKKADAKKKPAAKKAVSKKSGDDKDVTKE